ncbi:MAG: aldo/keto reductase [Planctomycetota bacterium]|jgi:aryl-alcohol dehydrogenase-like predicted oxidoreductase
MDEPSRRQFIASSLTALVVGARPLWAGPGGGDDGAARSDADAITLPTVPLGRTGRTVPRLGFGGYPVSRLPTEEAAIEVVRRALDLGVRYFDTAPSYGLGRSESRIGRAIAGSGIPREELFIATKTLQRDGAGARRELEESLARLRIESVDSVQVHEVHDDVETLFGPGQVLEALEQARVEGLVRHIGITGHRNPRYLVEAIQRYDFATALVPINPLDPQHLSFIGEFLPVASERGVAVIAMKVFAGGGLLTSGRFEAAELLRYALSQPHVAVAVPGCEAVGHVEAACRAVAGFEPIAPEGLAELERRAGRHEGRASEWYKEPKPASDPPDTGGDRVPR